MMSWVWAVLVLNILLTVGMATLMWLLFRKPKDDPRLSRGLQLLQSKISILEDISDRTEIQVRQLITLMDQKIREVQQKIQLADKHVQLVKVSMEKSREVAKIFEDRIPHEEIIERQTTTNYVRAAKMAHEGKSMTEIMQQVPLPRAELELLLKLNKQQLMFSEDLLPDWLKEKEQPQQQRQLTGLQHRLSQVEEEFTATQGPSDEALDEALTPPKVEVDSLKSLGERFRQACEDETKPSSAKDAVTQEKISVQKVRFPRLQL